MNATEEESSFTCSEISQALIGTIADQTREPLTSIWASFWKRITQGGEIPAFITVHAAQAGAAGTASDGDDEA